MKPATNSVLGRFGFRRTLLVERRAGDGHHLRLRAADRGHADAVIVAILFLSGLSRSMEFTTINALSFSDLDHARMSGANTLFSMLQQMGNALGVACAAVMLRRAALMHPASRGIDGRRFHFAFWGIGLVGLIGVAQFRRLPVHAGEVIASASGAGEVVIA